MAFIMKMLGDVFQPSKKHNEYTFSYNGPDMKFMPGESANIPLGYQLNELPDNYVFEMHPHQDLINLGFSVLHKLLQPDDYGVPITCPIRLGSREQPQEIKKGHNLFSGVLKSISDVALDILPFAIANKNKENVVPNLEIEPVQHIEENKFETFEQNNKEDEVPKISSKKNKKIKKYI